MNNRDNFQYLPAEIQSQILPHFDHALLRQFKATSRIYYQTVSSYATGDFYYAVGKPINMYNEFGLFCDGIFNDGDGEKPSSFSSPFAFIRTSFSYDEMMQALHQGDNTIRLFGDLGEALSCKYYAAKQYHDKCLDTYYKYATPAVYVINLKSNLQVRFREFTLSSEGLLRKINCLETPAENCEKVFFSKLYISNKSHFFASSKKNEWVSLWNEVFEKRFKCIDQAVSLAVSNLFGVYINIFFADKRLHHQKSVELILESTKKNMPVDKLHIFLKKLRNAEKDKIGVDEKGRYCQMLDFAIARINEIQQAAKLKGIDSYYKNGLRS